MPLPPAHFLIGAAAAEGLSSFNGLPRWRLWLTGGVFGVLPDMDKGLGVLLGYGTMFRGVFTHSFLALFLVLGLFALAAGRRVALLVGVAYGSHLLLDLLEDRAATNVQPWWPLTDQRLDSLAPVFPNVPWRKGTGVEGAAASLVETPVLPAFALQTGLALGIFLLVFFVRSRQARGSIAQPGREKRGI